MMTIRSVLRQPLFWVAVGLTAVSLLVWWIGPEVVVANRRPWDSLAERVVWIAALILLTLVAGWWSGRKASRAREQMSRAFEPKGHQDASGALAGLMRSVTRWRRDHDIADVYSVPWYLLLGAPGVGKSALVQDPGLGFPQARDIGEAVSQWLGGLRQCRWWFSPHAVVIENSRRRLLSESDVTRDEEAWLAFLRQLRAARPRRPLNGVVVAVSVSELLGSEGDFQTHSGRVAQRLQGLRRHLGMAFPLYLVVTQCDRLQGFEDSFRTLDAQAREQVWGFTLPWIAPASDREVIASPIERQRLGERIEVELTRLTNRLREAVPDRLMSEDDPQRRTRIFAFPEQFGRLQAPLRGFVQGLGSGEVELPLLRGIYFCSATQAPRGDGATLDPIGAVLAKALGPTAPVPDDEVLWRSSRRATDGWPEAAAGEIVTVSVAEPAAQPPNLPGGTSVSMVARQPSDSTTAATPGRTADEVIGISNGTAVPLHSPTRYFLSRWWREVVLAERGLAGVNRVAEARRQRCRRWILGAMALLSIGVAVGWGRAYQRNVAYVAAVQARLPALAADLEAALSQSVEPATTATTSTTATGPMAPESASASDSAGARTRSPDSVEDGAALGEATLASLKDLLPLLERLSQSTRRDEPATATPLPLFDLGLSQQGHLDAGLQIGYAHVLRHVLLPRLHRHLEQQLRLIDRDRPGLVYDALKGYLMLHSPQNFEPKAFEEWLRRSNDLSALPLSSEELAALMRHVNQAFIKGALLTMTTSVDRSLVAQARALLNRHPLEGRAMHRLDLWRLEPEVPGFSVVTAAGSDAALLFARTDGRPLTEGIPALFTRKGFEQGFMARVEPVVRQLINEAHWVLGTPPEGVPTLAQALRATRDRYFQSYVRRWDEYLSVVALLPLDSAEQTLNTVRLLSAPDSPLQRYLAAAAHETTLGGGAASVEAAMAAADRFVGTTTASAASTADSMTPGARRAGSAPLPTAMAGKGPVGLMGPMGAEGSAASVTDTPLSLTSGDWAQAAAEVVDAHFQALHRLLSGEPPALDAVTGLFGEVLVQLQASAEAQRNGASAPADRHSAALRNLASNQPMPLRELLTTVAEATSRQSSAGLHRTLNDELRPVTAACRRLLAGRYPFDPKSAADLLPDDFVDLFGSDGLLDRFFHEQLAPVVDTRAARWRFQPRTAAVSSEGVATLLEFQRAARIREAFFASRQPKPGARVEVRLIPERDGPTELSLQVDGVPLKLTAGDASPVVLTWPSERIGAQIRVGLPGQAPLSFDGPWALLRLVQAAELQEDARPERVNLQLRLQGRPVRLQLTANRMLNPLRSKDFQQFRCPVRL
ncbi:ImcF-related family protein [Roseateles amylovorans]|uniref:Type VI secretion system membrane subunit TssM n=1 Tax=Roseateles amylovorans TaxID=2978473 RepID=A0ABY6B3H5_9BURK|nr:ImcF-related family protein [Roseateles amylovorans]UXH78529.1 hypothetical protein N4261_00905 [Roseateles amylovorans]